MKVKAVKNFADKLTPWVSHKVGDVLDVPDTRANDLIERGLATTIEPAKTEEKPVPKKRQKEVSRNVGKGKKGAANHD